MLEHGLALVEANRARTMSKRIVGYVSDNSELICDVI